jgi:hypothetical protein
MALYGSATLLVALIVGLITVVVGWTKPFYPLTFLILVVPFRDFMTRWLNVHTGLSIEQVTAIGRWWFVVIAALLAVVGGKWLARHVRDRTWPPRSWLSLACGAVIGITVLSTLISPNKTAAFASLRGYLQPLGVFLMAMLIRPSRRELRALLISWIAIGAIMAAFGIWQGTTWSAADYRAEGYVRQNGELVVPPIDFRGQTYIRPASTVSGPNELGLDMAVMFFIAAGLMISFRRARKIAFLLLALLFTAGLAVTLSRSSLLAYIMGSAVLTLFYRHEIIKPAHLENRRSRIGIAIGIGGVLLAIGLVMASTGLISVALRTVQSLTSQYHYLDSANAIAYLFSHPAGVGMGLVEPKGALVLMSTPALFHVEGSLFQIGMEMGIWGLAIWLAFWGIALSRVFRIGPGLTDPWLRAASAAAFAAWTGSLVAFLFLPLMQSISLMVWLWALLGLGLQAHKTELAWKGSDGGS